MNLTIQLNLLAFSFFYGIFFSLSINLNYKLLYNEKKLIKILSTILFVGVNVLLYFIILLRINNGILHFYSLLIIVVGFILENYIERKLVPKLVAYLKKKWYNHIIGRWLYG